MFILCILFFLSPNINSNSLHFPADTTKIKKELVQNNISHVVKPNETLYSLLKKYNNTSAEFIKNNPEFKKNNAIKIGQVLYFKVVKIKGNQKPIESKKTAKDVPAKLIPKPKIESPKTKTVLPKLLKLDPEKTKNHIVKEHETVFSISKIYGISVNSLIEFNKLEDNLIYVGQSLALIKELRVEDEIDENQDNSKIVITSKPIKEKGIASVVVAGRPSSKLLALHRNAAIGSWVTVKNEATGSIVQAKVIGNLSEKGIDEEILIKLSPAAYYKLKPKDSKLRAEVIYYEQ